MWGNLYFKWLSYKLFEVEIYQINFGKYAKALDIIGFSSIRFFLIYSVFPTLWQQMLNKCIII